MGWVEISIPPEAVKNLSLMRWLVKLVASPSDCIILDPFAGSGSTLIAAFLEGKKYIGIEQSEEYVAIAKARLEYHNPEFALRMRP